MEDKQFAEFDAFADDYRRLHTNNLKNVAGTDSEYFAAFKVSILSQYETSQQLKFLDLGCGDGLTEYYVEQSFPCFANIGIDVSHKSIETALNRNLKRSTFQVYDGRNIPFGDQTFDVIFIAGVFHHVEKDAHLFLMKEVSRVLKKGGRLYLFEHNPWNPLTRYLVKTCVFDENARLVTANYMQHIISKCGFEQPVVRYIIFFPRHQFFKIFQRLEPALSWLPLGGQYYISAVKN